MKIHQQRVPRVLRLRHVSEPPACHDGGQVTQAILDAEAVQRALLAAGGPLTLDEVAERTGIESRRAYEGLRLLIGTGLAVSDEGRPFAHYTARREFK